MKYYLAFDRGMNRKDFDRYVRISNDILHQDLDGDNNLKALCAFTSKFNNEQELKDTLIKLNPKLSMYRYFNLVIVWNRKYKGKIYIRSNGVPYKDNMQYFNFSNLIKIIVSNVYEPFFSQFINCYSNCNYLNAELWNLYAAISEYRPDYIIEDAVRAFLNKELYDKNGLSFNKLYKMAMLISKLLSHKLKDNKEVDNSLIGQSAFSNLSETEMLELEWLNHRARLRTKSNGYY